MIKDIISKVKRLLIYTQSCRKEMIAGVFFVSIERLISIWMIADLLGNCVRAIEQKNVSLLWQALVYIIPWFIALIMLNVFAKIFFGITTARAAAAMRSHLLDILLKSPLAASLSSHSGVKLSYFTNDINAAFESLLVTLITPVSSVIVGTVCLIYVLYVHWVFAVIALVIGVLTYLYSIIFAKRLHKIAERMQAIMAVLESRMKDILDGMVISRIYGMRKKLETGMESASNDLCDEGILWARVSGFLGAINNLTHHFSERIMIFTAGLFLLSNILSLPELMRVSQMAGGIMGIFHISRTLAAVQRSMAGAQRVFDVLDNTLQESSHTICEFSASTLGETTQAKQNHILSFKQVAFGYNPAQPVLRNLSFDVEEGEMIAITGISGSGKSTVLRLCQGLYLPTEGYVKFMGTPTGEWDTAALRDLLSLVPQEPVLFPGTIAENISIGYKTPDKERILQASVQAYAHDFIMAMPDAYDTQVAERGASLSGGQRQRIAIARALYHNAAVLLLDEATSAMDAESEAAVHNTLVSLKGKKTILYVTHRETAVRLADRVLNVM